MINDENLNSKDRGKNYFEKLGKCHGGWKNYNIYFLVCRYYIEPIKRNNSRGLVQSYYQIHKTRKSRYRI